jgi:hypothetical protein
VESLSPEVGRQVWLCEKEFNHHAIEEKGSLMYKPLFSDLGGLPHPQKPIDVREVARTVEQINILVRTRRHKAKEFFGPTTEAPGDDAMFLQESCHRMDERQIVGHGDFPQLQWVDLASSLRYADTRNPQQPMQRNMPVGCAVLGLG